MLFCGHLISISQFHCVSYFLVFVAFSFSLITTQIYELEGKSRILIHSSMITIVTQ